MAVDGASPSDAAEYTALLAARIGLTAATQAVRGAQRLVTSIAPEDLERLSDAPDYEVVDLERPDGGSVRVHLAGNAADPVALLAHGYGLHSGSWNPVANELLAEGHRVVAIDWRAHGGSTIGEGSVTTETLVGDLCAVVEELALHDVLLVAHSTGGFVAMAALVEHPALAERLRGLLLVATLAGELFDGDPSGEPDASGRVPVRLIANESLHLLLAGFFQSAAISSAVSRELLDEFVDAEHGALASLVKDLAGRSYYDRIHTIEVPTVVVIAGEDNTTPATHGEAIARELPDARLVTVAGASHLVNWQHPRRIAELVRGFDEAVAAPLEVPDDRRAVLVLNPASGRHDADETEEAVAGVVAAAGGELEVRRTEGEGDARRWAAELTADGSVDLLIVAGGDGTVREVCSGVAETDGDVAVAIIPMGTANLLARALRVPVDDVEAAAAVAAGRGRRRLDVMHLVDRDEYATLMVDAGFDAHLVRDASRGLKDVLGAFAYVAAGLRNTVGLRTTDIDIELDGDSHTVEGHSVLCLNVGRIGQSVVVDESIELDDGSIHVGVVRRATPWQVLLTAAGMVALGRDAHPNVEWYRAQRVRIDPARSLALQLDGDPIGETPVELALLPQALEVAVPVTGSS